MGNGLGAKVVDVRTVYGARIVKVFEREDESEELEERSRAQIYSWKVFRDHELPRVKATRDDRKLN